MPSRPTHSSTEECRHHPWQDECPIDRTAVKTVHTADLESIVRECRRSGAPFMAGEEELAMRVMARAAQAMGAAPHAR